MNSTYYNAKDHRKANLARTSLHKNTLKEYTHKTITTCVKKLRKKTRKKDRERERERDTHDAGNKSENIKRELW